MKDGFLRVIAASPETALANPEKNASTVIDLMTREAETCLMVFPELFLTGATCGDILPALAVQAEAALGKILHDTQDCDILAAVGLPVWHNCTLRSAAAVIHKGNLLGVVPKGRFDQLGEITMAGQTAPFGRGLLFGGIAQFCFYGEPIPEDALVTGQLAACAETADGWEFRRDRVRISSEGRAVVFASSGTGESTGDWVYSGHRLIAENGVLLGEASLLGGQEAGVLRSEVDLQLLRHVRRNQERTNDARDIPFSFAQNGLTLTRRYSPSPFLPDDEISRDIYCKNVFKLQTEGLKARLKALGDPTVVVAFSGGLDSALALLVASEAAYNVLALTMPGPGTTSDSNQNARALCSALGVDVREIPINASLEQHLKDIGHEGKPDTAFENAQARERTQIAMDIANSIGGIVIGTGDLSETALGFSTYNGDHMSMYGVNAGVTKTTMRAMLDFFSRSRPELRIPLKSILTAPVSPELLPVDSSGAQTQRTENILGDYAVHDFFLYHFIKYGFSREKLLRLAIIAFDGKYTEDFLSRCLTIFFERFFTNQFKRSCMPDGVCVCSVSLSPRGGWIMPSDLGFCPL